ncbi:MAG: hypothetical protein KKA84_08705 [Bacteroidetes bacterium]|nr:hypothetical protein [Bacteroidota bacterium]
MKKLLLVLVLLSLQTINAQFFVPQSEEGLLGGGMGVTWIDGAPHYAVHIFPDFSFGNWGFGLDLNLEFTAEGKLRTENFNEFSDYLNIIRYLRYGQKGDPLYARLGSLDYATLGHGSIMYMYNNSPSWDTKKAGLEFDVDFNTFGFESVYGNFAQAGVMGLRGYLRPLQLTELRDIPILGNLEVGATIVSDFDKYSGVSAGIYNQGSQTFESTVDDGSVTEIGLDLGLPVVRSKLFDFDVYFDYAKIINFGSGATAGMMMRFKGLGLVDLTTKFERRFNGDNYIPSYFNSFYEIERFHFDSNTNLVTSKIQQLEAANGIGNGWYGELFARVLGLFNVIGSYQRLDNDPQSGILHMYTMIAPDAMPIVVRAGYDKIRIQDEGDLFKLDDRSYLYAELGYKANSYILVSMVYQWTFTPVRDADDNIIDFAPQKRIEPRISFIYPVDL